jgi:tRNA pseudouridine38-40 synthase
MINVKLAVAYDGTRFLGWQKTKEGVSVEESLQAVLEQIVQEPVVLQAASRTDAGVHAREQVVNFFTSKARIDTNRLLLSLNGLLPKDIAVLQAEAMPMPFHPTLDCTGKEYHYWICTGKAQLPMHRSYSWHYPYRLDKTEMEQAAECLIGVHDFQAFCNGLKNAQYESCIREVTAIEIHERPPQRLQIVVKGNHFLYKMVRNLVGTLVYVGRRKIRADAVPAILHSRDRKQAGAAAPAHGLTLYRVFY